jgi:hypothetical protein
MCRREIAEPEVILRGMREHSSDLFQSIEAMPGTVADVKHLYHFLFFKNEVDYSINVRLVAVKQLPELVIFSSYRTSQGHLPKA